MKEFNYPSTIELECGLKLRPYITYEELRQIVGDLATIHDALEREYKLDCTLLNSFTNVNEDTEENKDGLDYDLLKTNGVFAEIRLAMKPYIYEIVESLKYEDSVEKNLGDFLIQMADLATKAEKKIPTQKKFDEYFNVMKDKIPSEAIINATSNK